MKFFKLIKNNEFLGVVSSNNFYEYNPINHTFLLSNEEYGEFIDLNLHLYRDYWMREVPDYSIEYEDANVEEISQAEYETIIEALREDPEIINDLIPSNPSEDNGLVPISDITEQDLEYLKRIVMARLGTDCNRIIENGFDLEIRGETYHFSLTTQDQFNLINLGTMAQTQDLIPYHADGEPCTFYTSEEMKQIVEAANNFKTYHTTYYNSLKDYVNSLETVEDIIAIEYGTEIPEEYKSIVLKVLEQ